MTLWMVPILLGVLLGALRVSKVKTPAREVLPCKPETAWQWPEPWRGQVCLRPEHPRVTYKTCLPATSSFMRFAPMDRREANRGID